jgi:hypothetical protein
VPPPPSSLQPAKATSEDQKSEMNGKFADHRNVITKERVISRAWPRNLKRRCKSEHGNRNST